MAKMVCRYHPTTWRRSLKKINALIVDKDLHDRLGAAATRIADSLSVDMVVEKYSNFIFYDVRN